MWNKDCHPKAMVKNEQKQATTNFCMVQVVGVQLNRRNLWFWLREKSAANIIFSTLYGCDSCKFSLQPMLGLGFLYNYIGLNIGNYSQLIVIKYRIKHIILTHTHFQMARKPPRRFVILADPSHQITGLRKILRLQTLEKQK